jgi:hypothetical protein
MAVEHLGRAVGGHAGGEPNAEPVHAVRGVQECGEIRKVHPHPSPQSGQLRWIGTGLVDGGHHREPREGVGRDTEAKSVTHLDPQTFGEASLQGDLGRSRGGLLD